MTVAGYGHESSELDTNWHPCHYAQDCRNYYGSIDGLQLALARFLSILYRPDGHRLSWSVVGDCTPSQLHDFGFPQTWRGAVCSGAEAFFRA